jgi:hypothetical protein
VRVDGSGWEGGKPVNISEEGWPCQRLRLGVGALLFVLFEITIGRSLPPVLTMMILALGVGSMISAHVAIHGWKQKAKLRILEDAMAHRRG